ncbi:DUF7536 family protein [Haloarcula litorea]|uniref:DUF7536 family protein n=1 Tax=Haloarcula litorea TaxID=3032579 RepID=UPI003AF3269A
MSDSESESGVAALVTALNVPRNAKVGFGLSAVLTVAILVLFVVLPGTNRPEALYLALAFVLLVSLGGLLTAFFTAGSVLVLALRGGPD